MNATAFIPSVGRPIYVLDYPSSPKSMGIYVKRNIASSGPYMYVTMTKLFPYKLFKQILL